MKDSSSPPSRAPLPGEADPHFGNDEEMLAWCAREGVTPLRDKRGEWDWQAAWDAYKAEPLSTPEMICGEIPTDREYLVASISRKAGSLAVARLAPWDPANPEQGRFVLDWIIGDSDPAALEQRASVTDSLDFLLIRKGEPKPWAYLCHHCTTASNLYARESGDVWWSAGTSLG